MDDILTRDSSAADLRRCLVDVAEQHSPGYTDQTPPGAVAAFQSVLSDRRRHLMSGDPLTRERAEAVLTRLRGTGAPGRALAFPQDASCRV